jgi:hypothetical protein
VSRPRHFSTPTCNSWQTGATVLSTNSCFFRPGFLGVVAVAGLSAFAGSPASADEAAYCLTCTGPDQTYRCRVTGEGVSQNDVFKLYCIVRIARKSRHASCAATASSENCHGVLRTLKYRGPSLPAAFAENPRVKRFISKAEQDYRSTPEVASDLPQENARSSRRSMFQGIAHAAQNAGAAIGSFARGSYRCLRSLFRNCRKIRCGLSQCC